MLKLGSAKTFGEYTHQVIQYSTWSGNFLVYHVLISFGKVIQMTTWRMKQGRNEEKGCEGVWWVPQSYQETGGVSYESTQTMMIHLPVWYAGAVLLKRDKGAGSHWWWSSDLLPRQKYGRSLVPCSHEANTRIIGVARGAGWYSPKIFSICSHFVLWEAQFQTKYCCSPKIKHLPPKSFWAGYATDSHHAACGACC